MSTRDEHPLQALVSLTAMKEREACVKYLERVADTDLCSRDAGVLLYYVADIRKGKHRRNPE